MFAYILIQYVTLIGCASLLSVPSTRPDSTWESLAIAIIQRQLRLPYVVRINTEKTSVSDNFLKTLSVPVQLSKSYAYENSLVFVVAHSKLFVSDFLDSAAYSTRSKLVFFVDCEECAPVAWILEQCLKYQFLNVVAVPITHSPLRIYTYFPFAEGVCFDSTPVLIDSFTNSFGLSVELFPQHKVWNLHNCTLKVSSFRSRGITFDHGKIRGKFSSVFLCGGRSYEFHR